MLYRGRHQIDQAHGPHHAFSTHALAPCMDIRCFCMPIKCSPIFIGSQGLSRLQSGLLQQTVKICTGFDGAAFWYTLCLLADNACKPL